MTLVLAAGEALNPAQISRFMLALAVLLGAARVLAEISRAYGQPAVLGEILAGVLLGPTVFGSFAPDAYQWLFPYVQGKDASPGALQIAEQGLFLLSATLLLLVVGLEVDLSTVRRQGKAMLSVSALGIALPLGIGATLALIAPDLLGPGARAENNPTAFAIFVGLAMSITALPVIAKILLDLNLAKSDMGMLVISSAMLNDLVGWIGFAVVLALLPVAAATAGDTAGPSLGIAQTISYTLIFLVLMLTVFRWLLHKALPYVQASWAYPGGVIAFVFVIALVCGAFTEWLGIHSIFGAFIAGVAIGDSYHLRERTRDTIYQFVTNFFGPIFFASIGLHINFIDNFNLITVGLVLGVALFGKIGGCYLGARLAKLSPRESWGVGFGMAAQGAVGIILGQLAYSAGLISEPLLVAIIIMALGTSLLSGPAMQRVLRLSHRKKLQDYLTDRHILIDPDAKNQSSLFRAMADRAASLTNLNADSVFEAVSSRERVFGTALPNGLAVPHARLPKLSKPVVILARMHDGIDFNAPDGQLARLICMILTPEDQPVTQIEVLSVFAQTFGDTETRQACLQAQGATEFRAVLNLATSSHDASPTPSDQSLA